MISVRKGNIEDLYYFEGYRIKNTYLGECVINNQARFYAVFNDKEMVSDFWIYNENNSIGGFETKIIGNDEMMNKALECIQEDYQYVTIPIFNENIKSLEFLKKYGFVILKEEIQSNRTYYILRKEL